ncbi:MAG: histidine kinase [Burkholderiales bacterium]|uniref:sensor histidine kinase n=1 Tax=Comamonas granuli TaxID=290309 RepID=UPI0005A7CFCA|nr:histidine kinase [Comamonas granuli]MCZ2406348.1 histidine kinase [Burkholderiales bacterium]
MQRLDFRSLLRHGLVSAAFSCAIALALTVTGQGAWDVQLAYSLSIGLVAWLVIDLGRLPLASEGGWPAGWRGALLIAAGVGTGYVVGTALGDAYSGHSAPLWQREAVPTSLVITVVAGAAISFFFYSRAQARQLQLQMAQAQRDAAEARLKLLEAQLEPHMLFNTLANLRVLVAAEPARAQAMLDHLIAYLRATLGGSRATQHPLADEFERLRDYLELMAVRMGPRLAYQLDLPEALRAVAVPPLLLQPLVENAIRHGLEPQVAGGRITVRAGTRPGATGPRLVLEVQDTGVGLPARPPAGDAPGSHFGLAQVRERLATLHGSDFTLDLIAGSAGGTSVTITFPLKTP